MTLGIIAEGRKRRSAAGPTHELLPILGSAAVKRVWVDNDDWIDTYLTEFAMAAAVRGDIILAGISIGSSIAPYNPYGSEAYVDGWVSQTVAGREAGVNSGMDGTRIPVPVLGAKGHLEKPVSGEIDDTAPLNLDAAADLVAYANANCSANNPLVVCCGGTLAVVADAYLQDPSIADKVVVSYLGGTTATNGYNEWADGWAAVVAFTRLNVIFFPLTEGVVAQSVAPHAAKARMLTDLPASLLRATMYAKDHPGNTLPGDYDADGPTLALALEPSYVTTVTRKSVNGVTNATQGVTAHEVPTYADDAEGNIWYVSAVNQQAGTDKWWEVVRDLRVWGGDMPALTELAADDFDEDDSATLGASWLAVGALTRNAIISGQAGRTTSGNASDKRTETYANDQYASVIFNSAAAAGNYPGIATRYSNSGSNVTCYLAYTNAQVGFELARMVAGASTAILTGMKIPDAGQRYTLVSDGTKHAVWLATEDADHHLFSNGYQLLGIILDDDIASGTTAIHSYLTSASYLEDWRSGNVT